MKFIITFLALAVSTQSYALSSPDWSRDAMIIDAFLRKNKLYWLARGDVFANKWVGKFMTSVRTAPIYRSSEVGFVDIKRNNESFEIDLNEEFGDILQLIEKDNNTRMMGRKSTLENNTFLQENDIAILDSACDTCAIGGYAWKIEEFTGVRISIISVGPRRDQTMDVAEI